MRWLLMLLIALLTQPAAAQFYKDKTLTLLVNYGVAGNADTEARVYQRHLAKHIPGRPNIIIRNSPGAGGVAAINQLGLNIGSQPDGLTAGYFTMSATVLIIEDPVLKVKIDDFIPVVAARGWNVVYARKDIVPGGYTKPADITRARKIFAGGYSRASSHDTRLRLALEVMNLPYAMVTGSRGVHVLCPLRRGPSFKDVHRYAHSIAEAMVADNPRRLTLEWHRDERGERIFVDVNRINYAQHAVAAYGVRARPRAPVAMPIHWEELSDRQLRPDRWTVANGPERLAAEGDAWSGLARHARRLPAAS